MILEPWITLESKYPPHPLEDFWCPCWLNSTYWDLLIRNYKSISSHYQLFLSHAFCVLSSSSLYLSKDFAKYMYTILYLFIIFWCLYDFLKVIKELRWA